MNITQVQAQELIDSKRYADLDQEGFLEEWNRLLTISS